MQMQIVITINWAEGRSNAVKKEIVERLVPEISKRTNTPASKIFIFFYDIPAYNSGIAGEYKG